jgi:DNA polymerase elongation subunit (family B)
MECFIYEWCESDEVDDETFTKSVIRGYGIDRNGKDIVTVVDDFPPYMYIELPSHMKWHPCTQMWKTVISKLEEAFERLRCQPPKIYSLQHKKKLYYYDVPEKSQYPFIFVAFHSKSDRMTVSRFLTRNNVLTVFGKPIHLKCHEHEASPLLQFLSFRDLPSAGWVSIQGKPQQDSLYYSDVELHSSYKHISKPTLDIDDIPATRVLSFDIEVNSSNRNKMPDPSKKEDVIFQISCIYEYRDQRQNILLSLGNTNIQPDLFPNSDTKVFHFKNEKDLLIGFKNLMIEKNPHILLGYNIFGFDIPYMIDRAHFHNMFHSWSMHGRRRQSETREKLISWSSSAYQNQEFRFLELEGRIQIDLLPIIRRDYKLRNYKLSTVSSHFLGSSKDPLTAKDIFSFYQRGVKKMDELGTRLMTCVGRYCLQDAILVLNLFHKLQTWIGLIEMAKLCNTSIHALYTQGQQIKVFSQIYKLCMYKQIVVESSMYHKNQTSQYMGAFVFDPVPGIYNNVIPFDFSSLYPSVIMAYNIDYSTFVTDKSIPDEKCHVIEWEEETEKYRFRFIKEPKGMLPSLLEDLLSQRKKTKSQMKEVSKTSLMYTVLDKRQLAYKVSANSMYGAMGVTKGYLPFLPGAMCTTAKGRQSIQKAADYVQLKHNGQLIYGDTDSIYCHFPKVSNKKLWEFALKVEKEFLELFPPPMKLVFEEKMYSRFLIFTKKRYLALTQNQDLSIDKDLTIRGVLLARRDNCIWIRHIYEDLVRKLMDPEKSFTLHDVEYFLIQEFNKLFCHYWDTSYITITKAVGKDYKIKPCPGYDEKTYQTTDLKKRNKRLNELNISPKNVTWYQEYKEKVLPAHAQLANRMKRRGIPVEAGTRIEYMMIQHEDLKAKSFKKIEDPEYQKIYSDILRVDYLYVLHLASNPLDQLLQVCFQMPDFVSRQYELRMKKQKVLIELESVFSPNISVNDKE